MAMHISIFALGKRCLRYVLPSKDSGFKGALGAAMLQGKQSHTIFGVPICQRHAIRQAAAYLAFAFLLAVRQLSHK